MKALDLFVAIILSISVVSVSSLHTHLPVRHARTQPKQSFSTVGSSRLFGRSKRHQAADESDAIEEHRNQLLDSLTQTEAIAPVIFQWQPERLKIWRRFKGTVLETSIIPALWATLLSVTVCIVANNTGTDILPGIGMPFGHDNRIRIALSRLDILWHMHLTVLSFFLAFYLNTANTVHSMTLKAARGVQGRLNDMNMIAASHAKRLEDGRMVPEAKSVVDTISRYSRLFVVLFYSAIAIRFKSLQDDEALDGMKDRDMITEEEVELLKAIPPKARYNAPLQWIGSTFARGCESTPPSMRLADNAHFAFLLKLQDMRGTAATIGDTVAARCPLAYVHLVQTLVDTFILLTPFAAIAKMGWFSIPATFTLSFFFTGLMNLSKQLLDPLNSDEYGTVDNINLDTLIQESNNGSQRWALTSSILPVDARPAQ